MMKVVKLGLISLLALFALLFLMSSLLPSQVRISRAVDIQVERGVILGYLDDMRKWKDWNLMVQDSVLTNARYDVGMIRSDQAVIEVKSKDSLGVSTEWTRGNRKVRSRVELTSSSPNSTIVQWYFDIKLKWYPWEKFSSIVFDKQLGPPMEVSLESLKKIAEMPR